MPAIKAVAMIERSVGNVRYWGGSGPAA